MSNLPTSTDEANWPDGVLQLESGELATGGVDGKANAQAKALVARTDILLRHTQYVAALTAQALSNTQLSEKRFEHLKKRVLMQGQTFVPYRFVVNGMTLTKSTDDRSLQLASGRMFMHGRLWSISADTTAFSVPTNESTAARTYAVYIQLINDVWTISSTTEDVPQDAMQIYTLTVPAGNTGTDISAATLTDVRSVYPYSLWVSSALREAIVPLPYAVPNAPDYQVHVDVVSASDLNQVGNVEVFDRQANAFKIRFSGSADSVVVNWSIINPEVL